MENTIPTEENPLRIGTRGSPLALAQAYETRRRLSECFVLPESAFEIVVIKTTGDDRALIDADRPLKEIGNKGLFTKEIEEQLLSGEIDIAVHSSKDMPTEQPEGLRLDCFLPREDPTDAFVSLKYRSLAELPEGAVVGTSSLRRRAQVLHRRPDLKVVEFRGNVQTRMRKLHEGVADATFLAMAGINRLALDVPARAIASDEMLPAVAQGAIGIERRVGDARVAVMLAAIQDAETGQRLAAERAFLAALDGSCETPIAGLAEVFSGVLHLRGEILKPDGTRSVSGEISGPVSEAESLGAALAQDLLARAGERFF
ncbi:MAG: hydroxymethylbilane synthase [Rhodobacterales bacterium]|nr:MAG: hydroxymethylbilane synthase [Rhodobacterales bacterium]